MVAHARREVIGVLRSLVEAVCIVDTLRRLQEGVVRHVVALGRHDGWLLRLEIVVVVVLAQREVGLLEVLSEGGIGEVG